MWRENLLELKKQKGMTTKQIADKCKMPEVTISRILSGKTDNPTIDNVLGIVQALGGSMDMIFEIFMGTQAVLGDETLAILQQDCDVYKEELGKANQSIVDAKLKIAELEVEIKLLRREIELKDQIIESKNQIIAVHDYYIKKN